MGVDNDTYRFVGERARIMIAALDWNANPKHVVKAVGPIFNDWREQFRGAVFKYAEVDDDVESAGEPASL